MNSINPTDLISVAAFAGIVLVVLAWRILAHDKSVRGASVMVFTGALLGTFAAAVVFGGLYRWTDHGVGLLVLGAVLAFCGGDFYFQVVRNHPKKTHKVKTPWVAAAGLGVAGMLFFGNITHVAHSIQRDAHLNGVTAVFTSVHKNG
jgi:drug/metabolite transporter (DMT)-like permease